MSGIKYPLYNAEEQIMMNKSAEIRDVSVAGVKKLFADFGVASVETTGHHCAWADIAIGAGKKTDVYRVIVIRRSPDELL
jgi:hypothetical protein